MASVNIAAGMPVAISRANGQFVLARADYKPSAFVAGMASAAIATGFVGTAEAASITLPNWTAIAGTATLAVGQTYFLGATGGITTTPPAAPNCITRVGLAVNATTLRIEIDPPIQL